MVFLASIKIRLALMAAAMALLAPQTDAVSIEVAPITPVGEVVVLDERNPAFGGRPRPDMIKPIVVAEDPTLSRAEVYNIIANNASAAGSSHGGSHSSSHGSSSHGSNHGSSSHGSSYGSGSGVALNESAGIPSSSPQRKLEATNADVQRLVAHFQQPMEVNFNVIQQKYSKGEFKPAPWPSSYWPTFQDSINARWTNEPSPAEKYATAFGLDVTSFMNTVSRINGIDSQAPYSRSCTSSSDCSGLNDGSVCSKRAGATKGYCIPTWYGICHAWAPASILEPEPVCDVVRNGVKFHPFDIKGLITEVYDGARITVVFTGARYDGSGSPVDEYGRYTDAAERDLGPGFFHIAVSNIMGRFGQSFVVDVNSDAQVWNQPVRSYTIKEAKILTPDDAAQTYFSVPKYPFNVDAKSIAYIRLGFSYINEMVRDGPLVSTGIVDQVTVNRDYYYLLELDSQQNIIGGEWLFGSKTSHPDFLWFPNSKPDENTVTAVGIKYKDVLGLLKESVACSPVTPPDTPVSGGPCGNDQVGPLTCPSGEYCQPWNPTSYQCRKLVAKCGIQETGVDYYGDDIATFQLLLPEQCCDKCFATEGCKAYTFINYNPDGKAYCYLKKGSGQKTKKVGAVSAMIVTTGGGCMTPSRGSCGSESAGAKCCPSGEYCQPWTPTNYQCQPVPQQCGTQEVGVDYYGDDIANFQGLLPGECCDKCATTAGCKAYSFVNNNSNGKSACYLKSGTGQRRTSPGVVSSVVKNPLPSTCATPVWGNCGNSASGAKCCQNGQYCQPWDVNYFQCIQTPSKCSRQYPNVDFYGEDITTVYGIGPGECCDKCAATSGCKAYTYVNDNNPTPACYLKKGSGQQRAHPTAVSGLLN